MAGAAPATVGATRTTGALPHAAAHTPAGGGAEALHGTFSEHALRSAFASGPDAALVVAGCTGVAAAALVLLLVRAPRAAVPQATGPASPAPSEERALPALDPRRRSGRRS
ncbi:hypothetical protein [Streptomyces sp. LUP30]|uniref:hypothetical protein n=1 Tax=Streptomyces sp. LUP30 TaxID=1890285 RepID=UPI0008518305|nr:hypothetical protein [Streptomyces sp. LUP30]